MKHRSSKALATCCLVVVISLCVTGSLGFNQAPKSKRGRTLISNEKQSCTKTVKPLGMVSTTKDISSSPSSFSSPVVETKQIQLSEVNAEVKICKPVSNTNPLSNLNPFASVEKTKPPLLFIHGSFHASWCWQKHFMPYFASLGYPCYAISLRGTGNTFAGEGVKKVKLSQHANDVSDFVDYIRKEEGKDSKPVMIAHSFGGLAIMRFLEQNLLSGDKSCKDLPISGQVSMCSVPPSGNGKLTMRYLRRSLRDSWKVTAGLAMKKCISDEALCRELFFDEDRDQEDGISDDELRQIQGFFQRDTVATIDLMDLAKQLPSTCTDENGRATFLQFQDDQTPVLKSLVIGAIDDFIVDQMGVEELATYYGVEAVMVESAHDVMLGSRWRNAAELIQSFLEKQL